MWKFKDSYKNLWYNLIVYKLTPFKNDSTNNMFISGNSLYRAVYIMF